MAVESTTVKTVVVGSGATGQVIPVPFSFERYEDLAVILTDPNGVDNTLVRGTHYTATGAGEESGGAITTITSVADTHKITVVLEPPITQLKSYTANDNFPAKSHESALDKLTRICQRLAEKVSRTFMVGESGVVASLTNRIFGTDATGKFKQLTYGETRTAIAAAADDHEHTWGEINGKPTLFAPSSHTHNSSEIADATEFATSNTIARRDAEGGIYFAFLRAGAIEATTLDTQGTIAVGTNLFANGFLQATSFKITNGTGNFITITASYTANRAIAYPDASGILALLPIGPFANDAAASSGGVPIGFLYYTADGSVKRRIS